MQSRAIDRVLVLVVVAGIIVAAAQAFTWIDFYDSTCGALYRPSVWRESTFCRQVMQDRALAVTAALAAATCAAYAAWLRRAMRQSRLK